MKSEEVKDLILAKISRIDPESERDSISGREWKEMNMHELNGVIVIRGDRIVLIGEDRSDDPGHCSFVVTLFQNVKVGISKDPLRNPLLPEMIRQVRVAHLRYMLYLFEKKATQYLLRALRDIRDDCQGKIMSYMVLVGKSQVCRYAVALYNNMVPEMRAPILGSSTVELLPILLKRDDLIYVCIIENDLEAIQILFDAGLSLTDCRIASNGQSAMGFALTSRSWDLVSLLLAKLASETNDDEPEIRTKRPRN